MGIVFRQSVKTTLVVFGGALLGAVIMLSSSKLIPKQEFGFTRNLTSQALLFGQILVVGLNSTISVYIHTFANDARKRKLLITLSILIPILFWLIVSGSFFFLHDWVINHYQPDDILYMRRYYYWLPPYALFILLQVMLEQFLASQMLVALSAFVREIVLRLASIAVILLFAFNFIGFSGFVAGTVLVYLLMILLLMYFASKSKAFGFSLDFAAFSADEYKELLRFSWFHFLFTFSIVLTGYLDIVSIPLYDHRGFSSVAVYSVAVYLLSIVQIPNKAMMQPTINVLAKAFANDETEYAKDIFRRSSLNILIATICIVLLICCNLDNIVRVINKNYDDVPLVFSILLIGRFVDLATGLNDALLSITKHYKFNFYTSFVLVGILFMLLKTLIPIYGVYGAAWGTTIVYVLANVLKYVYILCKLKMQPLSGKSFLVILCGLPALAIGYFLPNFFMGIHHMYFGALIDGALRSCLIVIAYILMLFWLKPSPDLVEYIGIVKKHKRLF